MGLLHMMIRDAERRKRQQAAIEKRAANARRYPATTRLAAVRREEREARAREELAARGIQVPPRRYR
jgi:hypothetical protein